MSTQRVSMTILKKTSLLDAGSSSYLEQLYEDFLENQHSVPAEWQEYFAQLPTRTSSVSEQKHLKIQAEFKQLARHPERRFRSMNTADATELLQHERKQTRVREFIDAYRLLGHLHADINPLEKPDQALVAELMPSFYGFSGNDFATLFDAGSLPGPSQRTLQQIIDDLNKIYCSTIASEFMHIPDSPERIWVQEQVEEMNATARLTPEIKKNILENLVAAEGLERYLASKYPGAKRFSVEGAESLIVALDTLIQQGADKGAREVIICMAHRGRLNVLVNILGKKPSQLFDEFEGKKNNETIELGDVKYHQGFSSSFNTPKGQLHLSLSFNPSHLEIVTPVVCGSVKARQERRKDTSFTQVLPIAIHGDASFAGQGVVMETLNMSETRGFAIGGTVHIIVNNQVGFTTSNVKDARSTLYCSDIGKMIEAPILHANGDDPEAVYRVIELALQYRYQFKKDVIVDLVTYRRRGHNEADEPSVTQPLMYQLIRKLPTTCTLYSDKLVSENVVLREEADQLREDYRQSLENEKISVVHNIANNANREFGSDWSAYQEKNWRVPVETGVPVATLQDLLKRQSQLPEGFVLHKLVQKVVHDRNQMSSGVLPLDWGCAENLAYASLLEEQCSVRLSGQDVGRGTFFHRHAVFYNQVDGREYLPLANLSEQQARFDCINSLLSEEAVLAFEYGFAKTEPKGIVIWEAQFGDFANGAQVVIDQFISSGEQKWGMLCGLVLFLPHGYEGQGAEHSSARLERYLQLCARDNIQVCVPTTPAQIFHLLRRQYLRPTRTPLVVMTPKSLLRHKLAVSSLEELSGGKFMPIVLETEVKPSETTRVILCSGKVYYDLLEQRQAEQKNKVAIVRIEQLYPFPDQELNTILTEYESAKEIIWCQEEPKNQGAWYNIRHQLESTLVSGQVLAYAGRPAFAAPAAGYYHLYKEQQNKLIREALG